MLDVEQIVADSLPDGWLKRRFSGPLVAFLRRVLHEREFVDFGRRYPQAHGLEFVEQVLAYFDFRYLVSAEQLRHVPTAGRVVIVANHPIGSLDGLALVQMVRRLRADVKIVANQLLSKLKPLAPVLLPVDNMGGQTAKMQLRAIRRHLKAEGAVLVFPAGVVSRWGWGGIRDGTWRGGFLKFSRAARAPVLPVHIQGRNSLFFYALSLVARRLSTLWLVPEMFKLRGGQVRFSIGGIVPCKGYEKLGLHPPALAAAFRKQVYAIGAGRAQDLPLPTYAPLAAPVDRQALADEIASAQRLGQTADGKQILLFDYRVDSPIIAELGRLRELTFRTVEEGTGKARDLDEYDQHYAHLLVWDGEAREIVGAYRVCDAAKTVPERGTAGLYSSRIYRYLDAMTPYFAQGLELGRSFVQPKYWNKRGLDYLWYGIGALVRNNPGFRYLFGAVSLSDGLPQQAKELIVYFYATHFPPAEHLVEARYPYEVPVAECAKLARLFPGQDYTAEFARLKRQLKRLGCTIPTLYKQYAELGEPGGVSICASGFDIGFSNALDGFLMVDIAKLKPAKYARYIAPPARGSETG